MTGKDEPRPPKQHPSAVEATVRPRPWLVIVTGEPGSGKTTLGVQLARALRLPFLSRDDVRGGLLATAGLWTNQLHTPSHREAAVTTFVEIVETIVRNGVSAVLEFVVFGARREALQRLVEVADCLVVLATCIDAPGRAERRDRADLLLNRESVLAALGHGSIDDYLRDPQREAVRVQMQTAFDLPFLGVRTDDGYDPPLNEIVDWIIDRTRR